MRWQRTADALNSEVFGAWSGLGGCGTLVGINRGGRISNEGFQFVEAQFLFEVPLEIGHPVQLAA